MRLCKLMTPYSLLITAFFTAFSSCKFRQKVPLIVHHAKIYTADDNFSIAEAMAIRDGKILETGSNDAILKKYEGEEELNAGGKTIYPGFIDAHAHFVGYAFGLGQVNLFGTQSWGECIDRIKTFVQERKIQPGAWIQGRGWDQNDWDIKEFPTKALLDSSFPNNPVVLERVDGHALIANQKAIELAGVQAGQSISGGSVETVNGRLTGIFIDNAESLLQRVIPAPDKNQYASALGEAQQNCFAVGLTSVQDCGLNKKDVDIIDALQKEGALKMKMYVMLSDDPANYAAYLSKGIYKTPLLNVGGFKLYGDGALGSRGACLIHDYSDKPGWKGFLLSNPQHFREVAAKLIDTKFQMCTHAIGDSGNREILRIYAEVLKGKNDKRWRIEHAQVVDAADFNLFGENNIIPSVQPTHATSDMYWAADRLGAERIKSAYAYKELLAQNGWIPLGTDFPVEDISPFKTFLAAVARQDAKGFPASGFQSENALTREETLRGMTIWAARAAFEEDEKGSLEKGKAADFIILDTDLMNCETAAILKTSVISTFINGEKVFNKKK
ncbi:MAG: amidohydrolase [Ferruginibacter sp.]